MWWKRRIPRYAFINWMMQWRRLPTADRLLNWGMKIAANCCLCGKERETHEQLFLSCSYAKKVWGAVMNYCGMGKVPTRWQEYQSWIQRNPGGNKFQKELVLLANSAVIYMLWWERNKRLFEGKVRDHTVLSLHIKNTIRIYVGEWRGVRKTRTNWRRCVEMGIKLQVFKKATV